GKPAKRGLGQPRACTFVPQVDLFIGLCRTVAWGSRSKCLLRLLLRESSSLAVRQDSLTREYSRPCKPPQCHCRSPEAPLQNHFSLPRYKLNLPSPPWTPLLWRLLVCGSFCPPCHYQSPGRRKFW